MNERCQALNDKPIKAMEGCPRINCQETNSTLETETQTCYWKTVKLRGGAELSIRNSVCATH